MYNWSTDVKQFKNKEAKEIWELEQLINYGLNGAKIARQRLFKYLPKLALDPKRRQFIELLINADSN